MKVFSEKNRWWAMVFFIAASMTAKAQWQGVITNIETGVPVRDVTIYTDDKQEVKTNYKGEYRLNDTFKSVTITHGLFLKVDMPREEMTDTIALLPRLTTVNEVIVWGKRPQVGISMKEIAQDASQYGKQPGGYDFMSLFYKKYHMNRKQRQRHDEIIKEY